MNCWKSYNISKEIGQHRLQSLSIMTGLLTFMILYVPFSLLHGTTSVKEQGIIPFLLVLVLLPILHSFMSIVPLLLMRKRVKLFLTKKKKIYQTFRFHTDAHLTKPESILLTIAPTILLTIPGISASLLVTDYYIYILLLTSIHIGLTITDFLFIKHIATAPKRAYIQGEKDGFDILLKRNQ